MSQTEVCSHRPQLLTQGLNAFSMKKHLRTLSNYRQNQDFVLPCEF